MAQRVSRRHSYTFIYRYIKIYLIFIVFMTERSGSAQNSGIGLLYVSEPSMITCFMGKIIRCYKTSMERVHDLKYFLGS